MFGKDPSDLTQTLARMAQEARVRANFNQDEARSLMTEWISQDQRFSDYAPDRLANRVHQSLSNGAVLELDDPYLRRQGQRRPLDYRR